MEKIDFSKLDDQALETARLDLAQKIEALPGTFNVCGDIFSWYKSRDIVDRCDYISITSRSNCYSPYCQIAENGEIRAYSFYSVSKRNAEDVAETIRYFQANIQLLSEEFRKAVISDYQSKKAELQELEKAYSQILEERRQREQRKRQSEELKTQQY